MFGRKADQMWIALNSSLIGLVHAQWTFCHRPHVQICYIIEFSSQLSSPRVYIPLRITTSTGQ